MFLPKARSAGIVVQSFNNEILLYDLDVNKAYHLNETLSVVYNCCNGETTFDELKVKHNFTDEIIYFALDRLKNENLLENSYASPFAGLSRREIVRKIGLASIIALPAISSVVAPTAANAASGVGLQLLPNLPCTTASDCRSNICNGTFIRVGPPVTTGATPPTVIPNSPTVYPGTPITIPGGPFSPPITVGTTPPTVISNPPTVYPGLPGMTVPGDPIFSPPICR